MTLYPSKTLVFGLLGCIVLASCNSEKKKTETTPQPEVATQPDELTPSETQGLTLHEKEELKVNEDNVMNPFPG